MLMNIYISVVTQTTTTIKALERNSLGANVFLKKKSKLIRLVNSFEYQYSLCRHFPNFNVRGQTNVAYV